MRNFVRGAAVALILACPLPAAAQSLDNSGAASAPAAAPVAPPQPYYGSFSVEKGKGKLIKLPAPVANLFVADPDTATVHPASPDSMFVFGKTPGETDIVGTDQNGNRIAQFTVTVDPSSYTNDRFQGQSQTTAPGNDVTMESEPNGVILHGTVDTPEQADVLVNQAKAIGTGTVTNDLTVNEPIQVQLKVRIASMSRNITRELGIDWSSVGEDGVKIGKFALSISSASSPSSLGTISSGGVGVLFPGGTFEGVIDALAQDNLAHVLAEPTLTTLSGTQANFQVGGQFPIPVSTSGSGNSATVTVEFKNYGVLLSFIPTVFSDGRIALQVAPSISSLNSANSASVSSGTSTLVYNVPSLNVTSASTTIILGSGQGMAIAGLLEDTTNQVDNGVPYLSEMPLVGALFRGDAFQREQQEVVITVTPYIVQPVDNPNSLASPDDGWSPANDLQRILLLRNNGTMAASTAIPGDAGFMVQ
jgi:pilus assembly protein CpaC